MGDRTSQERVTTIERLLDEVESLPDAKSRELAMELVAELLELYGEGLARMMEVASATGASNGLASELADDELVSHLLLVHGLHPVPVEARVQSALDEVRPYLDSHGGDVELLEVDDTVVRLRMEGSCSGCPSSAMTLKLAIEQAIAKSAPEIESVEAEGANDPAPPAPALLQIEMAGGGAKESSNGSMNSDAGWTSAGAIPAGAEERGALVEVSSQPVLICSVDGAPYAYRPGCPACDASLEGATIRNGELICPDCEKRFDVRRAGRCLDAPQLHLEPIPLLAGDDGGVKVALGAGVAA